MSDRSQIDPAGSKRKRQDETEDSQEDSQMSPIIKPTKRPKISSAEKMAVNGSTAQREKNSEFIKKAQSGEVNYRTRVWDKEVYLAERRQGSNDNLESLKILQDDQTEFLEIYNHSNILAGK